MYFVPFTPSTVQKKMINATQKRCRGEIHLKPTTLDYIQSQMPKNHEREYEKKYMKQTATAPCDDERTNNTRPVRNRKT